GIRVKLPDKASEQVGRGLTYLTDYLALSSLVALFTAALGIIYLLRRYLYLRRALVGTLKALGVRGSGIFVIYLSEVIILGLCASVLAVTVAGVSMPLLSPLLGKYLGLDMTVKLPLGTIVMIFSVATILSALL